MKRSATCAAALAALTCAGALRAHHSAMTIDMSTPVWIKGTVTRYAIVNPHTMIELDATTADGQVVRWTIEGPIIGRIQRMGVDASLLQNGDVIEVCGFRPKKQFTAQQSSADADAPLPPYVHGHVLVMPNGRMLPWGPYGKMENCIRAGDELQTWLDFLNTTAIARDLWCNRPGEPTIAAAVALESEINRRMASPCN